MVELAVVMPVVLLLIFGVIEFGQIMFVRQTMINAATVGAREATLPGSTEFKVQTAVERALSDGGLPSEQYTIWHPGTSYVPPADGEEYVTVRLEISYGEISLLGAVFGEFTIGAVSTQKLPPS